MKLVSLDEKNVHNSLSIAAEWIWYGYDPLSNILLAAWIESVTTMTLETLLMEHAWLIPHLIAKSSASVLVTKEAWWTVLISGRLAEWMCKIDVAISFLMLALVIMTKFRVPLVGNPIETTGVMGIWTLTIFIFFSFIFSDFTFTFSFSLLYFPRKMMKQAHDKEVTWQVTWCDVTSLEHGGIVWKMMAGHMEYTWWPWVRSEADMRMEHGL